MELSIGDVARRAGLRPSTLRYYEEQGVLPAPRRVNGRRRYSPGILPMLQVLRFAQRAGFSLAEIRTLFHADAPLGARWEAIAKTKLDELDAVIDRATQMKRAVEAGRGCDCVRADDCVITTAPSPGDNDAHGDARVPDFASRTEPRVRPRQWPDDIGPRG